MKSKEYSDDVLPVYTAPGSSIFNIHAESAIILTTVFSYSEDVLQ